MEYLFYQNLILPVTMNQRDYFEVFRALYDNIGVNYTNNTVSITMPEFLQNINLYPYRSYTRSFKQSLFNGTIERQF